LKRLPSNAMQSIWIGPTPPTGWILARVGIAKAERARPTR
jgi:hypothetical protein